MDFARKKAAWTLAITRGLVSCGFVLMTSHDNNVLPRDPCFKKWRIALLWWHHMVTLFCLGIHASRSEELLQYTRWAFKSKPSCAWVHIPALERLDCWISYFLRFCFLIPLKTLFWVILALQALGHKLKPIYGIPLSTLEHHSPIQKPKDLLRDCFPLQSFKLLHWSSNLWRFFLLLFFK